MPGIGANVMALKIILLHLCGVYAMALNMYVKDNIEKPQKMVFTNKVILDRLSIPKVYCWIIPCIL